jgi:flagellar hook-associated protein 2
MGTIASSGAGSGLDVTGLVQKLVAAEGAPKSARLDTEEAKIQAKLSALGTLRGALAAFRDTVGGLKNIDGFRGRQVSVSSAEFLSGTAGTGAVPASYSIEVDKLALAQKLQSKSYAAATTVVGTGTLSIVTGGQTYNITIDATNNTVAGIASAINTSAAGAKVSASVVTGVGGAVKLTLTARTTGTANALTISQSAGDGGLADLVSPPAVGGLTEVQAARNAQVFIDGITVTSSTNTISGAIAGVDLNLVKENADGVTTTVTVGYDRASARKKIDDLVKSYNAVVDAIKNVASFDVQAKKGGPLFGDAGVTNIAYQLRRELTSNVAGLSGSFDVLGEIGVSAGLDGKLSVNGATLDAAFNADFDGIGKLFSTSDTGVAVKLDKVLDPYLQTGGVFDARTTSLKTSIDDIAGRREALNVRLTALHDRYFKQFNALDGLLAKLQSTSNFLTQQLNQLPGSGQLFKN